MVRGDSNDALLVAEKLGIPFQTVDLVSNTKKKKLSTCSANMKRKNSKPDVLVNVKLNLTFSQKIVSLGADYGYRSLLQEKKLS
jgi:tRNA-specific 2-thiouridylase